MVEVTDSSSVQPTFEERQPHKGCLFLIPWGNYEDIECKAAPYLAPKGSRGQ